MPETVINKWIQLKRDVNDVILPLYNIKKHGALSPAKKVWRERVTKKNFQKK